MDHVKIITKRLKTLSYLGIPMIEYEHVYEDKPDNIDTWDESAGKIAREEGIDPIQVHRMLFRIWPERYGPLAWRET